MMDPISQINGVFSLVVQEETRRTINNSIVGDRMVFGVGDSKPNVDGNRYVVGNRSNVRGSNFRSGKDLCVVIVEYIGL